MTTERYFYHAFPRRSRNRPDADSAGLSILESVLKRGLLLTPEMLSVRESLANGSTSEPWNLFQKRICFTELTPGEIQEHAKTFGSFAFEWEIPQLIHMGAMPVFYFPSRSSPNSLDGLGNSFLYRMYDIEVLLSRLESLLLRLQLSHVPEAPVTYAQAGKPYVIPECSWRAISALLPHLTRDLPSIDKLAKSVRGIRSFFYPTDNLIYTGPLAYYRQREWRIVGSIEAVGRPVTVPVTQEEAEALLAFDPEFFGKEFDLTDGRWKAAQKCQVYRTFQEKPVISTIRRVIAPASAIDGTTNLLRRYGVDTEVIALEACSPLPPGGSRSNE